MSQTESDDIRSAAESLINQTQRNMSYRVGFGPPGFDINRPHSINLITEEFLSGYMQDGRMSVVRRFFCLFVTFDLFFVSLLWLICIMLNGDNIFQAFQKQVVHYTIYTSLVDVVAAAICRFIILILFYGCCYVNHWSLITLTTSGSCLFLIAKVYVFDWVDSKQQAFEVILILMSFILSWGEAWFLDCRVIPQERHARRYFSAMTSNDRTPLMAPFLASQIERGPAESVANFYSPLDTIHNSDDEDEQDEDYHQMGLDCVRRAYELLESTDWKVEKVSSKGDTICSTQREKLGKIYKLTGRLKYPAKALMEELFYRIEDVPKWNPTLLESKIIRKINSYTDITYQASVGGGGGIVKSRDFVNLRCWRLLQDGKIVNSNFDEDCDEEEDGDDDGSSLNRSCEGSVATLSDNESTSTPLPSSVASSNGCKVLATESSMPKAFKTLSSSLGANTFGPVTPPPISFEEEPPPLEDTFQDAKDHMDDEEDDEPMLLAQGADSKAKAEYANGAAGALRKAKNKVWLSAAISVEYAKVPATSKYTRGENLVTAFAFRPIEGKKDACIVEWILCLDLKGYIPRYVLDTAYTTFMNDYMKYLRKYVNELRGRRPR